MTTNETLEFEIAQLLEAIHFRYGYDFKNYAQASLQRRVLNRVALSNLSCVSDLTAKILHDEAFFELFLKDMSITVTEMFRDPHVFKAIRQQVVQHLKTYPRINIWHAGCATGEEVYSMAILLKEEGLLDRAQIYATDYNNHSLEIARKGIYPAKHIKLYTQNYLASGAKASFADYYSAKYDSAKIDESLKKNITFANHNLMKDQVFAQMHLILCRNVLIYFDKTLQDKVLNLFQESLMHKCYLVLGDKESLEFSRVKPSFEESYQKEKIYRKKNVL